MQHQKPGVFKNQDNKSLLMGIAAMALNLFVDTNVFLDFFRLSSGDLEEVRKIARLEAHGHVNLLISDVVVDEFKRNRESVIAAALAQFKKSSCELNRPNIIRAYAESDGLEEIQRNFRSTQKSLCERVEREAAAEETRADIVIGELFSAVTVQSVPDDIINNALRRVARRRPPGKEKSPGDAIHWEWLLLQVPEGEDLHLISRDGDFGSDLSKGRLSKYLEQEWEKKKNSRCVLYESLPNFLKDHFPSIRLADEIDREAAVQLFEGTRSFVATHSAIAQLSKFDEYDKDQLLRLINVYISNEQIYWILGDADVEQFAHRLVEMAYAHDLINEVYPVEELLNDLELARVGGDP